MIFPIQPALGPLGVVIAGGGLPVGLTNFWKMEDASNGPRVDAVGTATLTDTTGGVAQVSGLVGFAARFDRALFESLSRATGDGMFTSATNKQSCAGWFKLATSAPVFQTVAATYWFTVGRGFVLGEVDVAASLIRCYVTSSSGSGEAGQFTWTGVAGEWHHIAMAYDGAGALNPDRLKVWFDGVEKSLIFSGTIPSTIGVPPIFTVGQFTGLSRNMDGDIDMLAFFRDTAIGQAQVDTLYGGGAGWQP